MPQLAFCFDDLPQLGSADEMGGASPVVIGKKMSPESLRVDDGFLSDAICPHENTSTNIFRTPA